MSEDKKDGESGSAAAPASAPPQQSGSNKLVLILTGVNLILCVGISGALFVSWKKQRDQLKILDLEKAAAEGQEVAQEEPKKDDGHGDSHGGGHGDPHGGGGGHGDSHGGSKKSAEHSDLKTLPLDQFTVNLLTPGGIQQKFIRINLALGVPTADVEGEIQAKMPQVKNSIIDILNSKRPADLSTVEGREFLKGEIQNTINAILNSGKLNGVFITNFAVTG